MSTASIRALLVVLLCFAASGSAADRIPSAGKVKSHVAQSLNHPEYRAGDIIDREQIRAIIKSLKKEHRWEVKEAKLILKHSLPSSHILVSTLRTRDGTKFMRQVASEKLIYDRLDRISREPGGASLIQSLVRLPDAHRYAKFSTRREIPDLVDFLPKERNGKTRKVADYHKPTGRIYTQERLVEILERSRKKALEAKSKKKL